MKKDTMGRVVSIYRVWWMKVNTRPARALGTDGVQCPQIITVTYHVGGIEYKKRKWYSAGSLVPSAGSAVTVRYEDGRPSKAQVL